MRSFIKHKIIYPLKKLRPQHHHKGLNKLFRWLLIMAIYGFGGLFTVPPAFY